MSKPVCLITGVGPGTGTALVERFSPDYQVAMVSRNEDRLAGLESRIYKRLDRFASDLKDRETRIPTSLFKRVIFFVGTCLFGASGLAMALGGGQLPQDLKDRCSLEISNEGYRISHFEEDARQPGSTGVRG